MVVDKLVEVYLRDGSTRRVLVHVEVQAHHDADKLYAEKRQSTRLLFQHRWSKKRIMTLFNAVNWMMVLPEQYQERYWREILAFKEVHKMELFNPLEQMFIDRGVAKGLKQGMEEGMQQGLQKGLQKGMQQGLRQGRQEGQLAGVVQGRKEGAVAVLERFLAQRFGPLSKTVQNKLAKASLEQLEAWTDALPEAESLKQLFE